MLARERAPGERRLVFGTGRPACWALQTFAAPSTRRSQRLGERGVRHAPGRSHRSEDPRQNVIKSERCALSPPRRCARSHSSCNAVAKRMSAGGLSAGTPGKIRTYDTRLRRPMLYPAELRAQIRRNPLHRLGDAINGGRCAPGRKPRQRGPEVLFRAEVTKPSAFDDDDLRSGSPRHVLGLTAASLVRRRSLGRRRPVTSMRKTSALSSVTFHCVPGNSLRRTSCVVECLVRRPVRNTPPAPSAIGWRSWSPRCSNTGTPEVT